jgi:lipopolysaccharide heptosyltransferase III
MSDALRRVGIADGEPLLVLHPGSGSPLKSWPLERLAEAGDALATALGARVVVTGAAHERRQTERLVALLPRGGVSLAGRLGWGELEALLARATLVVGIDSGPLHLAVAAGTPSVALFGPADPAQFGPWESPGSAGPPPCMRGIGVKAVLAAARTALGEGRDDPAPVYQA